MNRAWIELDEQALLKNIAAVQDLLQKDCSIMAVVKADAYGHGACQVANCLERHGIRAFAVATLDEAIALRKGGVTGQILILGYTAPDQVMELLQYQITQTIVSPDYAEQLNRCCEAVCGASLPEHRVRLDVHVALDTGMHRIGIDAEDLDAVERIYRYEALHVTGVFSHLCVADSDEPDQVSFTRRQIEAYQTALHRLRARGIDVQGTHLLNSYGCINYPQVDADFARLGLLMFGVRSMTDDYLAQPLPMEPVMTLRAHITSVRTIAPGETVGYGRTYCASAPTRIATVAIGYADGISRNLSGKLRGAVHGRYVPQVGRICMDQLMLDVTDVPDTRTGDIVTLIGRDGPCVIRAEELAEKSGTITNELLSRLGGRLENHGFVKAG